jgi:hypothetical protein
MVRASIAVALAGGLLAAVTAAAAAGTNRGDRINAARTCATLRAANGSAFALQYASFSGCTSRWTHIVHHIRLAALAACHEKRLHKRKLARCIRTTTATRLSVLVTAAKNGASACATQLASLGTGAFEQTYGANHNLRNAFGKCISRQGRSPRNGSHPSAHEQHYSVKLSELNDSGISGMGRLLVTDNTLKARLTIRGLANAQSHTVTLDGLGSGSARCPTRTADSNHDGIISLSEGQPTFGNVLVVLGAAALTSEGWSTPLTASLLPLQTRTIVLQGGTANGSFDATLPIACGTITLR